MLVFAGAIGWVCVVPAAGQTESSGNFLNLSFTGDGRTPTSLELHAKASRSLTEASFATTASPVGDAGWSIPMTLPPALQMPSLAVSYSSGGGYGLAGRGFSVTG